jgi:hypothetical protein
MTLKLGKISDLLFFMYRMFHLKRCPSCNNISKLSWQQYNKRNQLFFSFYVYHKHPPEILLPVGELLSYSVLVRIRIAMRSNVRHWTHVLFVNTACSHLHSFCATGVSSGLATRVTLTRVSRCSLESITGGWTCFWFNFCTAVRDCCWIAF